MLTGLRYDIEILLVGDLALLCTGGAEMIGARVTGT